MIDGLDGHRGDQLSGRGQDRVIPLCTQRSNDIIYGYGSIPINTIFSGMNIHFTSYFDVHQGYKVLTHCHIIYIVTEYCIA